MSLSVRGVKDIHHHKFSQQAEVSVNYGPPKGHWWAHPVKLQSRTVGDKNESYEFLSDHQYDRKWEVCCYWIGLSLHVVKRVEQDTLYSDLEEKSQAIGFDSQIELLRFLYCLEWIIIISLIIVWDTEWD